MDNDYEILNIKNQLCFPLYACAKEITKRYKPVLDEFDLTFTQYIAMMVMWEKKQVNVKTLGECLYLDSGTLTPLLKKLESKGYIRRERSKEDERILNVTLTEEGERLKESAVNVPGKMHACVPLTREESEQLYRLLYKILETI